MSADELTQFDIVVTSIDPMRPDAAAVEELALAVRDALTEAGVRRIEQPPGPAGPDGTRSVELLGIMTLIVTSVQTTEALAKAVRAIQSALRRIQARPARIHVRIAETRVEIAADGPVQPIIDALRTAAGAATNVRRSALVVANSRYDDPLLAQLRGPAKDADVLARVLGDPAIGGFDVDLLMDADETAIRRRVARFFADRDRDDVLLLYFSCHGVKDQRGRLYLAASDTDVSSVSATAVAASFVNDQMAQTHSQRVLVVLDCCYSGAFTRGGTAVRGDRSVHVGDEFSTGTGRIVLTASSATEYSFEGAAITEDEGRPSVFTTALVSGLATGEADLAGDGEISVDELYDYTYRQVRKHTPDQTPMKWTFGVEGSLVIARSVKPPALPAQIAADLTSDRPALRVEAVHALALLRTGGNAAMRDRANAELHRLRTDDSDRVRIAVRQALGEHDTTPPAEQPTPPPPPQLSPIPTAAAATPSGSPASPPTLSHAPATLGLSLSHPWLLTVLAALTLITLVQVVQVIVLGPHAGAYAGINFLVIGIPAAAISAWQMRRAGQIRWALILLGTAILALIAWLVAYQGLGYTSGWQDIFTFVGTRADVITDLVLRWALVVPALAWYALTGPTAAPGRTRSIPGVRQPALLVAVVLSLAVALLGAYLVYDDGQNIELRIVGTPIQHSGTYKAHLGLGNLYEIYSHTGTSGATLLWTTGWLALTTAAIAITLHAVRRRLWWWTAAAGAAVLASVVAGFLSEGHYQYFADTERLGGYLAAIAGLPALAAIAYAVLVRRDRSPDGKLPGPPLPENGQRQLPLLGADHTNLV